MSVQNALRFIADVRNDPHLAGELEALGQDATVARLVVMGKAKGLDFTAEEFREAFKHDWTLRRARYSPAKTPDPSE